MKKENLEKTAEISLLFDFYGELLPESQQELFRLHHEEDLSLAEIGEERGITRQGVHDTLRRAESKLRGYEEKLGLMARFLETEERRRDAVSALKTLIEANRDSGPLVKELERIRKSLENLE